MGRKVAGAPHPAPERFFCVIWIRFPQVRVVIEDGDTGGAELDGLLREFDAQSMETCELRVNIVHGERRRWNAVVPERFLFLEG